MDDEKQVSLPPTPDATSSEPLRLLKRSEVAARCGLSASMIYRLIDEGSFPPPARIGGAARWRSDLVREWCEAVAPRPDGEPSWIANARKLSCSEE